jgi:NAD-dependent DNA ligase
MKVSDYLKLNNEELEKELRYLNKQYREGNPLIADDVYDYLLDTLKERDPTNTFFKEVGAPIVEEKNKVELPYKMFSLDKIKNEEKPFQRWRLKYPGDVVVSHKLDGNSGLLYIKNGKISLYSRGTGIIGQDISFLVPYISIFRGGITSSNEHKQFLFDNYEEVAIRGELILSKKDWEFISSKVEGLSNPRNTVAGTLNAKAPNPLILSKIRFVTAMFTNTGSATDEFTPQMGVPLVAALKAIA